LIAELSLDLKGLPWLYLNKGFIHSVVVLLVALAVAAVVAVLVAVVVVAVVV
jgi:hypothetical protein